MDVRKRSDGRSEDAAELTASEQLRIDFRRKQIRIAHWELQYFLRAHESHLPPADSTSKVLDIELYQLSHFIRTLNCGLSHGKLKPGNAH